MEEQNIVITSLHSWDSEEGTQIKSIATEFSKKNKVLFVNPPIDRITKFRQRNEPWVKQRNAIRRGEVDAMQKLSDTLRVFTPPSIIESIGQVNGNSVFDALNRINNRRFGRDIRNAADSICFREFALFCDSDIYNSFYLKEALEPTLTVYFTHDDPKVKELWKHHGGRLEPILMKEASLVVCSSMSLTEQARIYNPNSYWIGGDLGTVSIHSDSESAVDEIQKMENSVDSIYKAIDRMLL